MKQYLEVLENVLKFGHDHVDRTGVGRRSIFGTTQRFDLSTGEFPIVTTREINPLVFIEETLFFIGGHTHTSWLNERGVKMWNAWAVTDETAANLAKALFEKGIINELQVQQVIETYDGSEFTTIGPMYGSLWRSWPLTSQSIHPAAMIRKIEDLPSDFLSQTAIAYGIIDQVHRDKYTLEEYQMLHYYSSVDQLNELVCNLKTDPFSSRLLVTAFNPELTPIPGYAPDQNVLMGKGALMPCHYAFQCFVRPGEKEGDKLRLSLQFSMRSLDTPVGTPHNISSYALLLCLLAHCCEMTPDELILSGGDTHVYFNQIDKAQEQILREPLPLPKLWLNPDKKDLFAFTSKDIKLEGYRHHQKIIYPVAV
jgi:thymidylate synthase